MINPACRYCGEEVEIKDHTPCVWQWICTKCGIDSRFFSTREAALAGASRVAPVVLTEDEKACMAYLSRIKAYGPTLAALLTRLGVPKP